LVRLWSAGPEVAPDRRHGGVTAADANARCLESARLPLRYCKSAARPHSSFEYALFPY